MSQATYLVFAFIAGMALGTFYFLNLWSSVQKMTDASCPWYAMYGNFVLRMGLVLAGFYLVMAGHWERLLVCLGGFVLTREILVRLLGRRGRSTPVKEKAWRS
jgi:F1F0 ATPase subunit 2